MHVQASEIDFSVQLCVYLFVHSPPTLLRQMAAKMQHMGSVCSSMSSSCLRGQVRFGGGVLLFILGSNLGGVGPVRGLRGGVRGGWCEEWARSG